MSCKSFDWTPKVTTIIAILLIFNELILIKSKFLYRTHVKLKKISIYWDKVYHNFYQANKEREKEKTAIEKIEVQLTAINDHIQNSLQHPYEFPVMPHTPKGLISYILVDIPSYCVKRIWHSKHIRNLLLIILICLWTIFMGLTGFIIRDNVALHERMQLIELQWRK